MTKNEFVMKYIEVLEKTLDQYTKSEIDEEDVFDQIHEIRGVFKREIPEIDDAIWLRSGTAQTDAKIVIGLLNMYLLNNQSKERDTDKEIDDFNQLKIEYQGIRDTIEEYTHDGNIMNYLQQLNIAIENYNLLSIKYCLNGIDSWYKNNISSILNNQYVFNSNNHKENMKKIEDFTLAFSKYNESSLIKYKEKEALNDDNLQPIIFLSHKSDDKKYGDALEKFITGLGVKNSQLIYTSHPLHKIPLDENIYDYLRKHIYSKVFMIILWSDKYLESPACLNEMGAAWVTQNDYTNLYIPSFSFGNPKYRECAVDTSKMGAVLNGDEHCKVSMIELKDKIQNIFNLENDEKTSQYIIDNFIKQIQKIQEEN